MRGIWKDEGESEEVNAVCRNRTGLELLATTDEDGSVKLFQYPAHLPKVRLLYLIHPMVSLLLFWVWSLVSNPDGLPRRLLKCFPLLVHSPPSPSPYLTVDVHV